MVDEQYVERLKKDKLIFLICILVLSLVCGYLVYEVNTINNSCNAHWQQYFKNCVCSQYTSVPMMNISVGGLNG